MKATIFKHEFAVRIKSMIIWSVAVAAIILIFMSLFPSLASQAALMNSLMTKFPPALRDAFGLGVINISTITGIYGFTFFFVQLCLAIQASNYGFGLVSIEEAELTADFLLTRPVSRPQVLNSKLLAALASLTVTNAVVWGVTFFSISAFNSGQTYDAKVVLLILATILLFQLFFLGVGLAVSLIVKRVRSVTPYALALAFGMYVINAFGSVFGDAQIEYLTPFKHFEPAYIIQNGALHTSLVLADVAVTLLAIALSYVLYLRRDIQAVS